MTGHRTGMELKSWQPEPAKNSFWANGCTREQLMQSITARRHQQQIPTISELQHDPALSATAALQQDHKWKTATR